MDKQKLFGKLYLSALVAAAVGGSIPLLLHLTVRIHNTWLIDGNSSYTSAIHKIDFYQIMDGENPKSIELTDQEIESLAAQYPNYERFIREWKTGAYEESLRKYGQKIVDEAWKQNVYTARSISALHENRFWYLPAVYPGEYFWKVLLWYAPLVLLLLARKWWTWLIKS